MSNLVISNTSLNNAANSGSTNGDSSMADLLTNSVNQFSNGNNTEIQTQNLNGNLMMNGNVMNNCNQQQQQQPGQINQQPQAQQLPQNAVPNFDFDFLSMNDNMGLDKK